MKSAKKLEQILRRCINMAKKEKVKRKTQDIAFFLELRTLNKGMHMLLKYKKTIINRITRKYKAGI